MAFLQPHGHGLRAVDIIGSHYRNHLPIRVWHGSPRTLYVFSCSNNTLHSDVDACPVNEARYTDDDDALFTPYVQDDASEISIEKVEFPPLGYPVPTFSATFKSNDKGVLSEKSQFSNPQMGPRFFHGSSVPFDQQAVLEPAPAHTRQQPPIHHLYQYDSGASNHSRTDSDTSVESSISRGGSGRKRWAIE